MEVNNKTHLQWSVTNVKQEDVDLQCGEASTQEMVVYITLTQNITFTNSSPHWERDYY